MANNNDYNWSDLAGDLYDKLTGKNAEITYDFNHLGVDIPEGVNSERKAHWEFNGSMSIRTRDMSNERQQ